MSDPLFDPDALVTEMLADDGALAKVFGAGYRGRPAQMTLSRSLARGMSRSRGLAGQGPTGTGKSLAYLIPAARLCLTSSEDGSSRRVLIATANRSLQRQLVEKDGPLIEQLFPGITVRQLQGIGNYLCLDRLATQGGPVLGMSSDERAACERVETWADETATGDRAELDGIPAGIWSKYSVSASRCRQKACKQFDQCWHGAAKTRAGDASVVVVSYALLLSIAAAAARMVGPDGRPQPSKFLSAFDYLICDEAHELPDEARTRLGVQINPRMISIAARFAGSTTKRALDQATDRVFAGLLARIPRGAGSIRLRSPGEFPSQEIVRVLTRVSAEYAERIKGIKIPGRKKDVQNALTEVVETVRILEEFDALSNPGTVYFLESSPGGSALKGILLRPGRALRDVLYRYFASPAGLRIAFLSATLQTTREEGTGWLGQGSPLGDSFGFISKELGLRPEGEDQGDRIGLVSVPSPFQWSERVALYVPGATEISEPGDDAWEADALRLARQICETVAGRALILCTSHRMVRSFDRALSAAGISTGIQQPGVSRDALVESFKRDEFDVLIGTTALGTGLDCPGLNAVILDRIPWARKDDPLMAALEESTGDGQIHFARNAIPRALMATAQRFGRLMRRASDRGILAVLDRRIVEKSYRTRFRRCKPPVPVFRSIASLRHNWAKLSRLSD